MPRAGADFRSRLVVTQLEDRTLPGFLASVDLSASQDSTMVDVPDTLTAVVAQNGGYTATGTIYFYENGATLIGSATLDDTGTATLSTSFSTNGDPSITADYGGDSNFNSGNSSSQNISVAMAPTTTVLTSSAGTSTYGQSVTLTATVSTSDSYAGTPTGTIAFAVGGTELGARASSTASPHSPHRRCRPGPRTSRPIIRAGPISAPALGR